jgi:hypothetical protein
MEHGDGHVEILQWNRIKKCNILVKHFIYMRYEHVMDTFAAITFFTLIPFSVLMNFYVSYFAERETNYKMYKLSLKL